MRASHKILAFAAAAALASSAFAARRARQPAPDPAAATQEAVAEGPLTATITAFEGLVRVRMAPGDKWQMATIGMVLPEGAELNTAPRAAVQFVIPPGQTITLDRASNVQIVRSNFENGTVNTDIGLKYGRTRFSVETAGRDYEATVRTPSAVLAVRGTDFIAYDQPPFAPEGVSLEGRVLFRDIRKQVNVGGRNGGRSRVTTERDSPAQTAQADTTQSARGASGANSGAENQLGITLTNFVTQPELQVGVFEIFADAQADATFNSLSVGGVLPNPGLAQFSLFYNASSGTDVDLVVTSPLGEVVTQANVIVPGDPAASNTVPSGGGYAFDFLPDQFGDANDSINWVATAPPGLYKVEQVLDVNTGTFASGTLTILNDQLSNNPQTVVTQTILTSDQPTITSFINLLPSPDATPTVSGQRSAKISPQRRVQVLTPAMMSYPIGPHPFADAPQKTAKAKRKAR